MDTRASLIGGMDPAKLTRRQLWNRASRLAIAAAAGALMPPGVQRALALGPARYASLRDIKHVVLLMQENRSFDHYFGTLAGVRGFEDPDALKLPNGKTVLYQPDAENPSGHLLPFHMDTRTSRAQNIPSTSHAWEVQHEAWNGGRMDQWLSAHRKADGAHGPYTMGYFRRDDIPFHFALAEAFTICDAYHCSVLGPTWPNRLYWMTGQVDPEGLDGGPIIRNAVPTGGLTWTTYAERLEQAGITWKVYQEEAHFGFNMLGQFRNFRNAAKGSPLYSKAMAPSPPGQFEYDALHDRLPAVSWLMPTPWQCEHPDRTPADGATFIASKLDAITSNPDVWAKTVFILDYDENDGMFDHVPPPAPEPGTAQEFIKGLPIGGGFRVPCIIVSPWTMGGWVARQNFDHTSVLQFLEKFTGVREPNISEWRRRTFGDLTSAFRFDRAGAKPPLLPDTTGALNLEKYEANLPDPPFPGADQLAPQQEKGSRKHT